MVNIYIRFILLFATISAFYVSANINLNNASGQIPNLTGVWASNDGGTYYISQYGNDVWWFGKSNGDPPGFANVFHGLIDGNSISGIWADVPFGNAHSHGTLTLQVNNDGSLYKSAMTGGFFGSIWNKQ